MIFNAIKNLFNKDENTEEIEYLGVDKDGNKIYEGYYHEFKGIPWVFNKTTYTREEFLQVEIYARLKADNGQYFTTEELLFKLHNLMANKELGDHVFFENLAYDDHEFEADDAEDVDDDDEGTPVFVVWLGS